MRGFDAADYRRIWLGLLSGLITSVAATFLLLELLARYAPSAADSMLLEELLRLVWATPQGMREMIWLADALRTVLRFLTAIPVITGLTGVVPASRHYQSARDLYLVRFICDAVFTFISVLLLTLDNRDLLADMSVMTSDLLRGLVSVLDLASYLVIGFTASVMLLRGMEDTLHAVGEDVRCPGLRRMRVTALVLGAMMAVFGAALLILMLTGMSWPETPIVICFSVLLLCFITRSIMRTLIASEMHATERIIREISK